ncbi:ribonuclease HIII [Ktedonospora formicarum]|uniref:Ribonuclease n=1 Tax=Ktedonospora formicarum TaxID=2778364 RepID=A0A8J3MRV7_9CHLR|nr:ribonuclease HIII [Ktedonospora formicarum]GHO42680.1 ribonuclease HIII [Ktedonospora formicarum]
MPTSRLEELTTSLRAYVSAQGWTISDEKTVQSGRQYVVSNGRLAVPITLYTTGKVNIQGQTNTLQNALKTWAASDSPPSPPHVASQPTASGSLSITGKARIGGDESGKGDYYGPLVVAAAYVNAETELQLQALGVRDSKRLTDSAIEEMAREIQRICHKQIVIRSLQPEQYNRLYEATSNLNLLLARVHAENIALLQSAVPAQLAIIDQFGAEHLLLHALTKAGCSITLEQRPRAEDDIAVAAASILARAAFVRHLKELSRSLDLELPKGASNPQIVTVGRELVAHRGKDALRRVAKLHFKTTETIIA